MGARVGLGVTCNKNMDMVNYFDRPRDRVLEDIINYFDALSKRYVMSTIANLAVLDSF